MCVKNAAKQYDQCMDDNVTIKTGKNPLKKYPSKVKGQ